MRTVEAQQFVYGRVFDNGVRGGRFAVCASSMSQQMAHGSLRMSTFIGDYFSDSPGFSAYAFSGVRIEDKEWITFSRYLSMAEKMERGQQFLVPVHNVALSLNQFLEIHCDLQ
ncbi:hypothetical protein KFU94_46480, partial [Chloroflexi bacterium TSY]|nr:hypothetical protein [Chloroflexi bacterium TSY]